MAVNNYAFKILALSYKFVINKIEILSLSRKREVPSAELCFLRTRKHCKPSSLTQAKLSCFTLRKLTRSPYNILLCWYTKLQTRLCDISRTTGVM